MTPAEADKHILLSRSTLHRYSAMMDLGIDPAADFGLIVDEMRLLGEIAGRHPDKADKVERLLGGWRALKDRLAKKLH